MGVLISGYEFKGVYTSSSKLENKSGVYAILKETSKDNYQIIYVGESGKVKSRIEDNHERLNCWKKNNFTHFAVFYALKDERLAIESEIRKEYNPTCNRK
ncbi:MAG: hypothetical protein K8953_09550 [Proteobacteria bacterium]|nr:hypothetical protein [Pseudomonadota bacterium]